MVAPGPAAVVVVAVQRAFELRLDPALLGAATFTASSSQTADSERGRIEDAGGLVEEGRVISPVSGGGLKPSRTVGDYEFKV